MNIASIDIGSNTVLLLLAKIENQNLIPILNKYKSPRLGEGLKPGGIISEEKINSLINVLKDYKALAKEYNCKEILVTATNAFRIASNGRDIVRKIKDILEFDVVIINGKMEAFYSYLGASSSISSIKEKIVIDIGGGSTEVVWGEGSKIYFKHSFQTGVVSLTEKFLSPFPYNNKNIQTAIDYLESVFKSLEISIPKKLPIIAVAGTPTTLTCINQGLKIYNEKLVEASILSKNDMQILYNELLKMSGKQILDKYGSVTKGREDVLFAGTMILKFLQDKLLNDRIYVSSRGVRYGLVIDYINHLK